MKLSEGAFWLNELMRTYAYQRGARSFTFGDLRDWKWDDPFFCGGSKDINWHPLGMRDFDIKPNLSQLKELSKAGLVKITIIHGNILSIRYLGSTSDVKDWEVIIPDPEGKRSEIFSREMASREHDVAKYEKNLKENFEWKIEDAVGDYYEAWGDRPFSLDQLVEELKNTGWWTMVRDLGYPATKATIRKLLQPMLDSGYLIYDESQGVYLKNTPTFMEDVQSFMIEKDPTLLEDFPVLELGEPSKESES